MAHLLHNFAEILERMKEKTSAGAVKIEQAECNQARLRLLRRSLFYLKNLSEKLHRNDILRKFAFGMTVIKDGRRTLRTMISITLPFDSRKSRKLKRISQRIASDVHALYGVGCSCCFVDSGCARTYVGKMSEGMPAPSLSSHCYHAHGGCITKQPSN